VVTGEAKSSKSNYLNYEKIGKHFFAVERDATNELSGKIKRDSLITKFDGTVLKNKYELYDFLNSKKAGDFINLTVATIDDANKTVKFTNEKIKIERVALKKYIALVKTKKDNFRTLPFLIDMTYIDRTTVSYEQFEDDLLLLTSLSYVDMLDEDFHKLYKYYDEVSKTKSLNLPKKPNLKKYVNLINKIKNTDVAKSSETKESENIIPASSGTGFFISKEGHIITNNHVIDSCHTNKVNYQGNVVAAKILARDRINDLALLRADIKPKDIFNISTDDADLLEEIYVAGYPFGKAVSSSVKVTRGVVSALSGLGDNYSNIQIDAALQPGNSGGPIINNKGNVVGIAVSKLDYEKVMEAFGTIPENTNFGIKSSVLQTFVKSNNLNLPQTKSRGVISTKQIGDKVKNATVYLGCWMTAAKIEEMQSKKTFFLGVGKGFDFPCYNSCKDRNDESFCRKQCTLE
jgi:S1-C subfamily serine protease